MADKKNDKVEALSLEAVPPTVENVLDPLDRNRHVFTKGRFESMGGPVTYEQGHGIPGFENQNRVCHYPPLGVNIDPIAKKLGVDVQEQ